MTKNNGQSQENVQSVPVEKPKKPDKKPKKPIVFGLDFGSTRLTLCYYDENEEEEKNKYKFQNSIYFDIGEGEQSYKWKYNEKSLLVDNRASDVYDGVKQIISKAIQTEIKDFLISVDKDRTIKICYGIPYFMPKTEEAEDNSQLRTVLEDAIKDAFPKNEVKISFQREPALIAYAMHKEKKIGTHDRFLVVDIGGYSLDMLSGMMNDKDKVKKIDDAGERPESGLGLGGIKKTKSLYQAICKYLCYHKLEENDPAGYSVVLRELNELKELKEKGGKKIVLFPKKNDGQTVDENLILSFDGNKKLKITKNDKDIELVIKEEKGKAPYAPKDFFDDCNKKYNEKIKGYIGTGSGGVETEDDIIYDKIILSGGEFNDKDVLDSVKETVKGFVNGGKDGDNIIHIEDKDDIDFRLTRLTRLTRKNVVAYGACLVANGEYSGRDVKSKEEKRDDIFDAIIKNERNMYAADQNIGSAK